MMAAYPHLSASTLGKSYRKCTTPQRTSMAAWCAIARARPSAPSLRAASRAARSRSAFAAICARSSSACRRRASAAARSYAPTQNGVAKCIHRNYAHRTQKEALPTRSYLMTYTKSQRPTCPSRSARAAAAAAAAAAASAAPAAAAAVAAAALSAACAVRAADRSAWMPARRALSARSLVRHSRSAAACHLGRRWHGRVRPACMRPAHAEDHAR